MLFSYQKSEQFCQEHPCLFGFPEKYSSLTILCGGSRLQRAEIFLQIASEARNRSLPYFLCLESAFSPYPIGISLADQTLVRCEGSDIPPGLPALSISLSELVSAEKYRNLLDTLTETEQKIKKQEDRCNTLRQIEKKLSEIQYSLLHAEIDHGKLDPFTQRFFKKIPTDLFATSSVFSVFYTSDGELSTDAFSKRAKVRVEISGNTFLCSEILHSFFCSLRRKRIPFTLCLSTDGIPEGIYLPLQQLYLGKSNLESVDKVIHAKRFLKPNQSDTKTVIREWKKTKQSLHDVFLLEQKKRNEWCRESDLLYEELIDTKDFSDFRKKLLVTLFCRYKIGDATKA
jgi:hypothetical protein